MYKTIRLFSVLCVVAVAAALSTAPARAERLKIVHLPSTGYDFSFDPDSGSLAAVDPRRATLTVYDRAFLDGKSKKPVVLAAGKSPVGVTFKRYKDRTYLAVVGREDPHMRIFDGKTLKLIKNVLLANGGASSIVSSLNPKDPYLYYGCGHAWTARVGRVHLGTLLDEGQLRYLPRMDLVVSASGKFFYTRVYRRIDGQSIPTDFKVAELVDGVSEPREPEFRRIKFHHRNGPGFVPDPFDRHVAWGRDVFTADMKNKVATLPFSPVCFFPDRPLVIGLENGEVVGASTNTFKPNGRAALPKSFFESKGPSSPINVYREEVFSDPKGERVLVARLNQVAFVPLSAMNVPDEPSLRLREPPSQPLVVGRRTRLKLTPFDKRVRIELSSGPKNLTLDGDVLVWTPGIADVGSVEVTLRMYFKKFEHLHRFVLWVAYPHIQLDFIPEGFDVSPDGKTAVAWLSISRGRSGEGETQLALVDLENRKVITQRTLPRIISRAAVDEYRVYVALQETATFLTLSRKDLSQTSRVFTNAPVEIFELGVPGRLIVGTTMSKTGTGGTSVIGTAFSSPDMKPLDAISASDRRQNQRIELPRRLPEGLFFEGCVWPDDMKTPRLLAKPAGFFRVKPRSNSSSGSGSVEPSPWGRKLVDGALWTETGDRRVGPGGGRILADYPVAVSLNERYDNHSHGVHLEMCELMTGARRKVVTLDRWSSSYRGSPFSRSYASRRLVSRGKKFFVLLGDRIIILPLDEDQLRKFPVPFGFQWVQQQLTISANKPTVLKHKFRGAMKPVVVRLVDEQPDMKIDAATGNLIIDGPAMIAKASKDLTDARTDVRYLLPRTHHNRSAEDVMKAYIRQAKKRFRRLVGRDARGIPVLAPIHLAAWDARQKTTRLSYQVFLEVPEEPVLKIYQQRAEERRNNEAQQAARRKQRWHRMAQGAKEQREQAERAVRPADFEQRAEELEKSISRLEAQTDLLIRILTEKKSPPKRSDK